MIPQIYTFLYRTGGTVNGKWHKTLVVGNKEYVTQKMEETKRMGYPTVLCKVKKESNLTVKPDPNYNNFLTV